MRINMAKYFGTNGVRGTYDVLTPQLAMQLAQAIGIYFKRGQILVARDHRLTGESLWHAVIAGLQSVGCNVVDLGVVSAPTAEFTLHSLHGEGLIIITASHNPPEWNALKVIDGKGISISKERGEKIEKIMKNIKLANWKELGKLYTHKSSVAEHSDAILSALDKKKIQKSKLRLVLDCGNGTAATIAPSLFRSLGCEVISLNSHMDGHFPGRLSEPSEQNVAELIAAVKAANAHAGIAWDGDGDRVIFIDEQGNYVIGDKVFALCLLSQLKKKKGPVVTTVATSKVIEDIAKQHGCKMHYTKIGAPYLSEVATSQKAILAGEEVGGVIWPEISLAKDGFIAAAKIVEMICDKPLSKLVAELPKYFNEKTTIKANDKEKTNIIKKMHAHAVKNKFNFLDIDGIRINFEDSWVIVRASGTEPKIRIFAEAKTKEKAAALLSEYKGLVEKIKKK